MRGDATEEVGVSMSSASAAFRFGLELAALAALGYWGWVTHAPPLRSVWAVGTPLVVAVVWAFFRAPGDASHGGGTAVSVPGPVRLALELLLFGGRPGRSSRPARRSWGAPSAPPSPSTT